MHAPRDAGSAIGCSAAICEVALAKDVVQIRPFTVDDVDVFPEGGITFYAGPFAIQTLRKITRGD